MYDYQLKYVSSTAAFTSEVETIFCETDDKHAAQYAKKYLDELTLLNPSGQFIFLSLTQIKTVDYYGLIMNNSSNNKERIDDAKNM